jgi:hypothetical protein
VGGRGPRDEDRACEDAHSREGRSAPHREPKTKGSRRQIRLTSGTVEVADRPQAAPGGRRTGRRDFSPRARKETRHKRGDLSPLAQPVWRHEAPQGARVRERPPEEDRRRAGGGNRYPKEVSRGNEYRTYDHDLLRYRPAWRPTSPVWYQRGAKQARCTDLHQLILTLYVRRPLGFRSIGVSTCVRSSSLLIGEGCNEFAAEVGNVWDHAAPD